MHKHIYKKKWHINKLVPFQWGWILAGGAMIIICLLLVAIATSQGRDSTNDTAFHPMVTGTTTPTSIYSTATTTINADQITGVFPLSMGGPIPVPANVLLPTNIARMNVGNVLVSIYAGSLVRKPTIGVLAILRENLTTGEQSLHLYQTTQPVGALTILTARNSVLTFSTPYASGTFNLETNQFSVKG